MASPELAELLEEMFAARDLNYGSLHDMRALMAESLKPLTVRAKVTAADGVAAQWVTPASCDPSRRCV